MVLCKCYLEKVLLYEAEVSNEDQIPYGKIPNTQCEISRGTTEHACVK